MDKKKILVVDDDRNFVEMVKTRLQDNGYDVVEAFNGEQGLAVAKEENPDLILLDIIMPGMEGSQVASMLAEDMKTKDIPIIFLTGLVDKEKEGEEIVGGKHFIAKPFASEEILSVVKKYIGE